MRKTAGMTPLTALRWIAPIEATSFLALLVASYVKHQGDGATGVQILGPIHGLLFLAYVALALIVRREQGWSNPTTGWVLLGAVLPFGGYVVEWRLLRDRPVGA
jgi:integral membrane protein